MTRIILVRHGRTPWNKDKIFRGSVDIPLDEVGREEASLLAEWLKGETIHAAYTSPLSRSRDTAVSQRAFPSRRIILCRCCNQDRLFKNKLTKSLHPWHNGRGSHFRPSGRKA